MSDAAASPDGDAAAADISAVGMARGRVHGARASGGGAGRGYPAHRACGIVLRERYGSAPAPVLTAQRLPGRHGRRPGRPERENATTERVRPDMRYGHFDDAAREYVITTPRTPYPWINYLGSERFFSLISHQAGGYSFYRDARLRRLTRYRYNNIPTDEGGRDAAGSPLCPLCLRY